MDEKISDFEVFWLGIAVILPTIIMTAPNIAIELSGGLSWISIIMAGTFMGLLNHLFLTLGCNFSKESIVSDVKYIFGPILGKIILIPYILTIAITNLYLLFSSTTYIVFVMERAPLIPMWIAISILVVYLSYSGIEVIARSNIIVSFILLLGIVIILLMIPLVVTLSFNRLKPFIFNFKGIIAGSLYPARLFFYHSTVLIILKPYFNDKKKAIRAIGLSNLVVQIVTSILVIFLIAILGRELAVTLSFPFHNLSDLSLAGVEVITFVIWILSNILKIGIFNFAAIKLIADWFELPTHKRIIIPFAFLIFVLTIFSTSISVPKLGNQYFIIGALLTVSLPTILLLILAYSLANKKRG